MKRSSVLEYFKTSFILLCICALSAALLGFVNYVTSPIIVKAEQECTEALIKSIFPQYDSFVELTYDDPDVTSVKVISDASGETAGYIVETAISGFKNVINIMVGLDESAVVRSVKIISHSETPGLGSKITGEKYLNSYVGKTGVISFNSGIDSLSGATVSSSSVLDGVNLSIKACEEIIKGGRYE